MSAVLRTASSSLRPGWGWGLGVAALAFAVRLTLNLRSGGLFGRIGYDGSVYYASASALSHGYLPYRDFLLLHPPGIVLSLLPFATLGRLVGDPYGLALARLAWFGLGALSAGLVFVVVRVRGLVPAVLAGVCYAVFLPAVDSEHTTSLEAVGSVCLLAAVALLTRVSSPGAGASASRGTRAVVPVVLAGALLGFSTGTKIWGVAVVLALAAWTAATTGMRRAGLLLAGAVGATVVLCLPFFAAAPGPMWRMVVLDQLGRRRVPGGVGSRLVDIVGLSGLRGTTSSTVLEVLAVVLLVGVVLLAVRDPLGRLATLLLVVTTAVLLGTPPWSVAYTGLAAPSVTILAGCAVARLTVGRLTRVVAPVVLVGLAGYAATSLPGLQVGGHFPGKSMERVLGATPGCVTTDDPILLIETGALQRNFALHCPVVVDPSGYSYDLQPSASRHLGRAADTEWQQFFVRHLASGDLAVVVRFRTNPGLSRHTQKVVAAWPVVAVVAGYEVHRPPAHAGTATR